MTTTPRPVETIPAPPDTFANPYLLCPRCQARVTNIEYGAGHPTSVPCGHLDGYDDVCPGWGPVDGCPCDGGESMHRRATWMTA